MSKSKIDGALGDACRAVGDACAEKSRCCEDAVRRSPLLALAGAAIAGYIFQILPLSRIVGALVKLVVTLLKPALLIYGAAKVVEYLRESCPSAAKSDGGPESGAVSAVENP